MRYTKMEQNLSDFFFFFFFTTGTPFTTSLAPIALWVPVVFKDHSVLLLSA